MIWPVKDYTLTQGVSPAHIAYDLAAPKGTSVLAPVTGTVIALGTNPSYTGGLYVIIREDHPDGWEYYTGHHSQLLVTVGQRVTEGQLVARIGQTGTATGPHTHFQIRQKNGGNLMHPQFVYDQRNKGEPAVEKINDGDVPFIAAVAGLPQQSIKDLGIVGRTWKDGMYTLFAGNYYNEHGRPAQQKLLTDERDKVLYPFVADVTSALGIPNKADKGLAQLAIQQLKDKANKPGTVDRASVLAYINEKLT